MSQRAGSIVYFANTSLRLTRGVGADCVAAQPLREHSVQPDDARSSCSRQWPSGDSWR